MKLLFLCGAEISNRSLKCASWIKSIILNLDDTFSVVIVSTSDVAETDNLAVLGNKKIRLISFNCLIGTKDILLNNGPDVIVVFGTENKTTEQALYLSQKLEMLDRTVIFAQGLCKVCAQHYAEGVPEKVIKRYTFRDLIRRQNIEKERESLEQRAISERKALETTCNFIGRTTMDRAILESYNPDSHYYKCNDVLRDCFYDGEWKYSDCEKHRIFISQYYYPIKGFHYLLKAVFQLKTKYPDIMIAAAGYNPIQRPLPHKELKDSSYIRYIKGLIKTFDLKDNIELLGELSDQEMKREYLKANLFVMPSTIENSPNSLAEAMMLGVPAIASDVGGVTDFATHKVDSYIYPSSATYLLAHYIDKVFSDKEKAEVIGHAGKNRAEQEYNRDINIKRFEAIMKKIAQKC